MAIISEGKLSAFCNRHRIKCSRERHAAYRNDLPPMSAVNYATYAHEQNRRVEYNQFTLVVDEAELAEIVENTFSSERELQIRRRYPTVRAAWEQYKMTLAMCGEFTDYE